MPRVIRDVLADAESGIVLDAAAQAVTDWLISASSSLDRPLATAGVRDVVADTSMLFALAESGCKAICRWLEIEGLSDMSSALRSDRPTHPGSHFAARCSSARMSPSTRERLHVLKPWPKRPRCLLTGQPLLMWSIGRDSVSDQDALEMRDQQSPVSAAKIRVQQCRAIGFEVPQVSHPKRLDHPGRQWTDDGEDKPTRRE